LEVAAFDNYPPAAPIFINEIRQIENVYGKLECASLSGTRFKVKILKEAKVNNGFEWRPASVSIGIFPPVIA
jgi:hypothetical protein